MHIFSLLYHSKIMLMERRGMWDPYPLYLTPCHPAPWSVSLVKPTDQERRKEHRNLEQRRLKMRSEGTGQGDQQDCRRILWPGGRKIRRSILFWLVWQGDISVSLGPVWHRRGFFQLQVTSSLQKEAALLLAMLMSSFSCRKTFPFPSDVD